MIMLTHSSETIFNPSHYTGVKGIVVCPNWVNSTFFFHGEIFTYYFFCVSDNITVNYYFFSRWNEWNKCIQMLWPLWESTSQGSPHLQTQLQDGYCLIFSWSFSYISFSSLIFTGALYRIFLLFLPWLPCHFHLSVIEQHIR